MWRFETGRLYDIDGNLVRVESCSKDLYGREFYTFRTLAGYSEKSITVGHGYNSLGGGCFTVYSSDYAVGVVKAVENLLLYVNKEYKSVI